MVCPRLDAGGLYLDGRIKIDDMPNGNCPNDRSPYLILAFRAKTKDVLFDNTCNTHTRSSRAVTEMPHIGTFRTVGAI